MYMGLHVKYLLLLLNFKETWIFFTEFLKILKYQLSWKSIQWSWVIPCVQTDGQTWWSWWLLFTILCMCLKMSTLWFCKLFCWRLWHFISKLYWKMQVSSHHHSLCCVQKVGGFLVILLKCLSKFLFCSVFDKHDTVLINYLLHPQNKRNLKDCLTQNCCVMQSHDVPCANLPVLPVAPQKLEQIFVRYCIILHVRKVC